MARWLRRPQPPAIPEWVLDPDADPEEAWAWLDFVHEEKTDAWFDAFTVLCSVPRYVRPADGTLA